MLPMQLCHAETMIGRSSAALVGLLEGMQSAEGVQRSRQVLAQISLAEIVLLCCNCCFLFPLLALEVGFLVSQQCLTSFMAIRPM